MALNGIEGQLEPQKAWWGGGSQKVTWGQGCEKWGKSQKKGFHFQDGRGVPTKRYVVSRRRGRCLRTNRSKKDGRGEKRLVLGVRD